MLITPEYVYYMSIALEIYIDHTRTCLYVDPNRIYVDHTRNTFHNHTRILLYVDPNSYQRCSILTMFKPVGPMWRVTRVTTWFDWRMLGNPWTRAAAGAHCDPHSVAALLTKQKPSWIGSEYIIIQKQHTNVAYKCSGISYLHAQLLRVLVMARCM